MRSTYLFLLIFLGGQAIADNGEVRCVAKVKVATMNVVKVGEAIYSIGYENIFIPKGYWHNSCEIDFPFAMSRGVTAFDGVGLRGLEGVKEIYVVGSYLSDGRASQFTFYTQVEQHSVLEAISWR